MRMKAVATAWLLVAPTGQLRAQSVQTIPTQAVQLPVSTEQVGSHLDSIVAEALRSSPRIKAASAAVDAAAARIRPAGTLPDPMLMVGIQNLQLSSSDGRSEMTMRMLGVSQTILYPGKLPLRQNSMRSEFDATVWDAELMRRQVVRDVKLAYYDISYIDAALRILDRNRALLIEAVTAADARYSASSGEADESLRGRIELARLAQDATMLVEEREIVVARINALRSQPSVTAVGTADFPQSILRAAVADSAQEIHFTSAAFGARSGGSALLPLQQMQDLAIQNSATLKSHEEMIAAQQSRVALAARDHLPDFEVSVSYGQRTGFTDLISAQVSLPIAIRKGSKQDQLLAFEHAELARREAEHMESLNSIRAEVARIVGEAEKARGQLAIYKRALLPQAQAALDLTLASYRSGRGSFLQVLGAQAGLFQYETEQYRLLADFSRASAELEFLLGREVISR